MGCGSTKENQAVKPHPQNKASKPSGPPPEDPSAKFEDPKVQHDPDLDAELNCVRFDKRGQAKGPNAAKAAKPDSEETKKPQTVGGMFEVEEAGAGDQALAVKPFAGAIVPPDNEPRINENEPNINLQLDYVYGYRCFDTRQNVFYTSNDRNIVYIAAAVGIVLDTNSNNQ
jgi:hypothetical protein